MNTNEDKKRPKELVTMSEWGYRLVRTRGYGLEDKHCCHTCAFWEIQKRETSWWCTNPANQAFSAPCTWSTAEIKAYPDSGLPPQVHSPMTDEFHFCMNYGPRCVPKPRLKLVVGQSNDDQIA